MRLTELLAAHNDEVASNDERLTHIERMSKREWIEAYIGKIEPEEWLLFDI